MVNIPSRIEPRVEEKEDGRITCQFGSSPQITSSSGWQVITSLNPPIGVPSCGPVQARATA